MTTAFYWFRNDLRLEDNPSFLQACKSVDHLLPVYIHQPNLGQDTAWGFPRIGEHRKVFLDQSLRELRSQLRDLGSDLFEMTGNVLYVFEKLKAQIDTDIIYCEQIQAPEELEQLALLRSASFQINPLWQSSMLDALSLPFSLQEMPDIFTQFRQQVEKQKLRFAIPVDAPKSIPSLPVIETTSIKGLGGNTMSGGSKFRGGERSAQTHIQQYFERRLTDTYKQTRNELIGMDYSSKFSPWLAQGCCSAGFIAKQLADYEICYGANDGTYWLWFELLWRDYFRFLHFKYGKRLYNSKGLSKAPSNQFDGEKFSKWSSGNTGESLIDAGMRELKKTGYLSNRMRQIVASYWIYDMKGDWQGGAAWFEYQLIDYDVYSNQGNWLYIAGKGTDPRGGRSFNVAKQTQDHDPDGIYRQMWLT
ncbi:DASH family cryptochrome [Polynucleobacter sp. JS-Fieb-80-E5]|jgi:deoxyribodipyrimidine photo-lyase|uniref:DASH family cryptochrome n=1 Tax=Polynucleobacter sp. JS-Fieb-80-E5 TaxID=2081050 RepID=UPI001C0DBB7B|nr:DASH family cryptochrome [Polynucleobacter sp. JS-Fieb-80-E5]MBU3618129.1 DASH family cryptochrome [Polynucleobacter sp. JS-Fieb-80-E5]